jgi:hypothetical protein
MGGRGDDRCGGGGGQRRRRRQPLQVYKWEVKTYTVRHYTKAILQPVCLALPLVAGMSTFFRSTYIKRSFFIKLMLCYKIGLLKLELV